MSWEESVSLSSRANDIFTALKMKKYLALLDDLWEEIDLQSIGIPRPNAQNKSKIVLTTRSLNVCGSMGAHDTIKVEFLNKDQSWNLFQEKVGQHTLSADPQIPKLAKEVAGKCHGLPLALIVVGASMASKTNPREWQSAISDLNKCAAKFPGMEERVLHLLKFSYDRLPSDTEKVCFLFCALYPEDYQIPINSLIEQWIGLGYIDAFEDYEEALNRGHCIIGTLVRTCLLENVVTDENVKMHDIIRELALWIARECGREEGKVFVKSGKAFTELPMTDLCPTVVQTISLIETKIGHLECLPSCPDLSTFSAQRYKGRYSEDILFSMPDDFFLSMPDLKFLDLSGNLRTKLPTSMCELVKLEYLDLSKTDIPSLPYEMRNLTKLKYLYASRGFFEIFTFTIPCGVIKNFSNLEILKLINQEGVDIDELISLNKLKALEINLPDFKDIEKFVSNPCLCICARNLKFVLHKCKEITFLTLSASPPPPSSSSLSSHLCLGHFRQLRKFEICGSSKINELIFTNESEIGLYEILEEMVLTNLPKLVISWDERNLHSGAHFRKLHYVELNSCVAMVDLTWLLFIPNLRTLYVQSCDGLQEILSSSNESGGVLYDQNTFSNLRELNLQHLPNLQSICSMSALPFPSLKFFRVITCPKLRRLSLDSNSASNTLIEIRGDKKWWNELHWDNEAIKTHFTPKFTVSRY